MVALQAFERLRHDDRGGCVCGISNWKQYPGAAIDNCHAQGALFPYGCIPL